MRDVVRILLSNPSTMRTAVPYPGSENRAIVRAATAAAISRANTNILFDLWSTVEASGLADAKPTTVHIKETPVPDYTEITTSIVAGVGTISFSRFERRNALSLEVFADLSDCLDDWRENDEVACVVITGGEEVFCAGLDLQLQSMFTNKERRDAYSKACLRAYGTLLDYAKPTIAAVGGPALGGGCDIAVFCDIRIGAENVIMGFPQIKMGLTPYFSPLWKIVGLSQAKLLTFSGDRIDAAEATRIGLLDRLVPTGTVVAAATRLAQSIAETSTESATNNKEMALRSPAMDPISALTYETLAYREVIWHGDVVERIGNAYKKLSK